MSGSITFDGKDDTITFDVDRCVGLSGSLKLGALTSCSWVGPVRVTIEVACLGFQDYRLVFDSGGQHGIVLFPQMRTTVIKDVFFPETSGPLLLRLERTTGFAKSRFDWIKVILERIAPPLSGWDDDPMEIGRLELG